MGPLAGLRVLDIASLYAAPLAASLLADFGADVVKVEPPAGDSFRGTRMWPLVARGKKSLVLDLTTDQGCGRLRDLIGATDVLVENFPPAVLERRGLAWPTLSAINPRLIMLSVSCFGQGGPYANRPGSGTIGEAFGGLTALTGAPDGPPMLSSVALGDCVGAMSGVIGVMVALYNRDRSGRGQQIDVSLYEPILQIVAHATPRWAPGQAPRRSGSKLPGVLRNVYATEDGFVAVSASTARHQKALSILAGGSGEEADQAADDLVVGWMRERSTAQVVEALVDGRIPVAPVNDLEALLQDPQVRDRASLLRRSDPELGELLLAGVVPRLLGTPGRIGHANPPLGVDGDAIVSEWMTRGWTR